MSKRYPDVHDFYWKAERESVSNRKKILSPPAEYFRTIEDAALDDLLRRMFYSDPKFVEKLVKTIFPKSYRSNNSMVIDERLYISLNTNCSGKNSYLSDFPPESTKNIFYFQNIPDPHPNYWYNFVMRIIEEKGWLPEKVPMHIVNELNIPIAQQQRFYFHNKPCYEYVLQKEYDLKSCREIIATSYPCWYGYRRVNPYWYKTENGNIKFAVLYYHNEQLNKYYFLPISAWRQVLPTKKRRIEYDLILPDGRLPIYNLDKLIKFNQPKYILICQFEKYVEYITKKYNYELCDVPTTSYLSIDNSDWSPLQGSIPIILPDNRKPLIQKSYKLYSALEGMGFSPLFIKTYKDWYIYDEVFRKVIDNIQKGDGLCSFREFAEHNLKEFDVAPPVGVLPTATRLSDKPSKSKTKEVLLKNLFDLHETMTLYAKVGVGKSLLTLLLALSFVSGKKILDGYVCPSRAYKVLLIDGELNKDDIYTRATKLCKGHGLPDGAPTQIDFLLAREGDVSDNLESEKAQKEIKTDLDDAEIIIIDSVFMFFPSAMDSKAENTIFLRKFITKWKKRGKTLIIIDHQGKTNTGALGSSTKEFLLDVIIRLEKSNNRIYIKVDKVRNHPSIKGSYLTLENLSSADGEMIKFKVIKGSSTTKRPDTSLAPKTENTFRGNQKLSIDQLREIIMEYIKKNPNAEQKDIVSDLLPQAECSRSTLSRRIMAMRVAGELDFWENPPCRKRKPSLDSDK